MCGINGFNFLNTGLIKKMNESIRHRGPDDNGIYVSSGVSLGHVRLSIIDISAAGHQPMHYSKKSGAFSDAHNLKITEIKNLTLVFNGEIYNFQDIRNELIKLGYSFSTKSDTEVILASYKEWGFDCVKKFNGMWAFCIFDSVKNILFLSRDRLGKKPLFYYFDGKKFIFSSELKGILEHGILRVINKEAVDFYFSMGFIPSPWSIYENVFKVEARQNIIFDLSNLEVHKSYYYDIPRYNPEYDRKKLVSEGRELLKDATRLRLISDVPVGAFLSGGLDSSSVVANMSYYTPLDKLHTFSIGFEGKYDETSYINIAKDSFKTQHHHKYFRENDFSAVVDKISFYYDEPFADYSNFPTYSVSALARKYVAVSLSGDGGDEIFGGYFMHKVAARLSTVNKLPRFVRKGIYRATPKFSEFNFFGQFKEAFRLSLFDSSEFHAELGSNYVYRPDICKRWSQTKMQEVLESCDGNLIEAAIKYDLFYNTLSDNFLVKVDRASMAHALEIRGPFLDYRFIEFASRIPTRWKTDFFKTKILMRDIISDLVPQEIVTRGKAGFEPPLREWINSAENVEYLQDGLKSIFELGFFSEKWYDFYKSRVLVKNGIVYDLYRIRLFLFLKWKECWIDDKA